jgi:hypothetical protein
VRRMLPVSAHPLTRYLTAAMAVSS